jgi:glycogen phosphorylase
MKREHKSALSTSFSKLHFIFPLSTFQGLCILFGLNATEVTNIKRAGYRPKAYIELRAVMDLICSGEFSRGDTEVFHPLIENLLHCDPFLVLADYADYITCQEMVGTAWKDSEHWSCMSNLNTARSGKFSSDRAIVDYFDTIWNASPVTIRLD